ncbi:MAG: galactokinase, partial [Verrucomicrobiota bacterium]
RNKRGELPALGQTEKLELAKLCHMAETRFVGLNCGLLDHISSLFGKAHHAMEIDCRLLTIQLVPMIGEIAIVVCNSGVKHELTGSAYNQLRQNCEGAARILGAKSLRSVEAKDLTTNKARLSERQYQCAYHVVGEIQRVVFGERALRDGNFEQFGHYMFQSHESSRDFFKNSCPELDVLVELARDHAACLGARLTGGGFGGATINLVRRSEEEDFMKSVAEKYERKTAHRIEPMLCQIVDGAS